jgi:uncharacterized protein
MERIESLDLIRGVAILGILLMNVMSMAAPTMAYYAPEWFVGAGRGDNVGYALQSLFVESRFMGLFSLLFGVGLAIQTDRMRARRLDPARWIRRRLGWLLLFGLVHGFLIWGGDILTPYAIAGFFAWRGARWSVRRLVVVGTVFVFVGQLPLLAAFIGSLMSGENIMEIPALPFSPAELGALRGEWTNVSSRIGANAAEYLELLAAIPLALFWHSGGVMLFGMALYRRGFFSRTDAWKRALPVASVGLVGAALVLRLRYHVGTDTSAAYATMGMMMIPGLCMAVGYASLLVPIASSGSRVVRALRSAGRMAFTLYISQSVVTVALFTFVVPHLWGGVGRIALWGWVIVFSVLQVIFAHWWQATHGQGPLERLWRFLSYRRMPAS